ncbi:ankyrin [Aspergillus sclerotioniger CBS 115572]|uniref:Ankyrin n=1 Tax=Aspergillus sclerotioniger CBS 115572 TaxID=1450535 RepID=A0A317XER2_9EURO|nr:ankyrin [Aspergillus sclerotioniger CBS 115572]PWY96701.1 ankyrin [Aspergillus sclerotioniger CBS 115572]
METPTPVQFLRAAQDRDFPLINKLILSGKSVNEYDKDGYSALHRAVIHDPDDLNTISILISYGANQDIVREDEKASRWKTPLHYAAIQGNAELVALLINTGADPAPQHIRDWRTPLEDAISNGHLAVVEKMLECFLYGPQDHRPSKGLPEAIILASRLWYSDVLVLLLEYKRLWLPINTIPQKSLKQAFCEAIQSEACGFSMKPFDERIGGPGDTTPTKVAELLLNAGINFREEELDRLLSITCRNSNLIDVTCLLLIREPNVTNYHIVRAIDSQSLDILTPLIHYAAWGLQKPILQYLLDTGLSHVHEVDQYAHTPLMYAFDEVDSTKEPLRLPVLQYLIEQGSDVTAASIDGVTALHLAVRTGSIDVVKFLLIKGSNLNVKSTTADNVYLKRNPNSATSNTTLHSTTPLHWAVDGLATVSVDVVVALLRFGADVNEPDGNGATALNILLTKGWGFNEAWESRAAVVDVLMMYGADVDVEDNSGMTARKRAEEKHVFLKIRG